jgi:hypothetical protein
VLTQLSPKQLRPNDVVTVTDGGTQFTLLETPVFKTGVKSHWECNVSHTVPNFSVYTRGATKEVVTCMEFDKNLTGMTVFRNGQQIYPV